MLASMMTPVWAQGEYPEQQTKEEFQRLMPITGTVETMAGDFELDHSSRAPGKAAKIYDLMDHSGPASSTSGDFRYVARNGRKYRPAFLMLASPIYE